MSCVTCCVDDEQMELSAAGVSQRTHNEFFVADDGTVAHKSVMMMNQTSINIHRFFKNRQLIKSWIEGEPHAALAAALNQRAQFQQKQPQSSKGSQTNERFSVGSKFPLSRRRISRNIQSLRWPCARTSALHLNAPPIPHPSRATASCRAAAGCRAACLVIARQLNPTASVFRLLSSRRPCPRCHPRLARTRRHVSRTVHPASQQPQLHHRHFC